MENNENFEKVEDLSKTDNRGGKREGSGRKGRGNFLSEIFDVRENLYPSPSGEYGLTSEFEGLLSK